MSTTLNGLLIRKRLGRDYWGVPVPFGPDGWQFDTTVQRHGRIIVTADPIPGAPDGWVHASMSWEDRLPTYDELVQLHKAVWPNGYAYQVFAPPSQHVNIHPYALHLWGYADGWPMLPEFGQFGTI